MTRAGRFEAQRKQAPPVQAEIAGMSGGGAEVEDDQGHVVFLGVAGGAGGPTRDFGEKFLGERRGGEGGIGVEELFAASEAELFVGGVVGFGEPIGIDKATGAELKRDLKRRVFCFGEHAKEESVLFDGI